ncbi:hypothetical protein O1611_g7720 [Lasiodiplodia mahajangana]|uniref:Uncharacterized protein n=1 Tax=Lasiodiplodia mahajangana TaxID=1108764 RepID=A0ACC2JEG0_9PEZI|nr:hypothetical protein O1611_g7720 [Lasiodiplodia mahajangana]
MTVEKPEKGDKVSWNWGGGAPGGTVAETKDEGSIAIKSKAGNTIKKNASPDNPAVHIARSGNDVVKRASELTVESKGSSNSKTEDEDGDKDNDKENAGGKRKAESQEDEKENEEASDSGDPHTINENGKEVKKGGKEANKKRKVRRGGDVKNGTNGSETSEEDDDEESEGEDEEEEEVEAEEEEEGDKGEAEKPKQTNANKKSASTEEEQVDEKKGQNKSSGRHKSEEKDPAPRNEDDEDLVSARTRSHDKEG